MLLDPSGANGAYNVFPKLTMISHFLYQVVLGGNTLKMPQPFSGILKKHNQEATEAFRRYVHTVCDYSAKRNDPELQNKLPLSNVGKY